MVFGITQLKSILRENNIRPNKRLGQNFLVDKNIQNKIIDSIGPTKEDTVLEVGPGLGQLTQELCKLSKNVIAVEKDRRLYGYLSSNLKNCNFELICGDILDYNGFSHAGFSQHGQKIKIAGNLPYYISSPLIIKFLEERSFIDSIFISVQKEFGKRLLALPGSKDYGSITCFVQFYTEPEYLFTINKKAFYPIPKVDSCFLKLSIRRKPLFLTDEGKLFKIIRASFSKRRKTILNSLCASGIFGSKDEIIRALESAGVSPERRPETISLAEFVSLAKNL